MKETLFQQKVLKLLRSLPDTWWEKISQRSCRGTPDIIGCIDGRFVAVELKVQGGRPSKIQLYKLERIREAGGIAELVYPDNLEEFMEMLHEARDTARDKRGE